MVTSMRTRGCVPLRQPVPFYPAHASGNANPTSLSGMNEDRNSPLPYDDPDLRIARRMGARRDASEPPEDAFAPMQPGDEGLAHALRAYKAHALHAEAPAADRLWRVVEAHLDDAGRGEHDRRPRLRFVRPVWAYGAAAVLAFAVLSWLLFVRSPAAEVVASAGADVVTYTAPDGSVVTLRPRSTLSALRSGRGELRYHLDGEAFFAVVRDTTRAFVVEANAARVRVLGTRFDVSTWGGRTTVYLAQGRVRLEHVPSRRSVVLAPGQHSTVTTDGTLLPPADAPAVEYVDWMENELVFAGRPLHLLLDELAHHYGVAFDVPPDLLGEMLTGTLRLDGVDQSLVDLGAALGGTFHSDAPGTYRFEPD